MTKDLHSGKNDCIMNANLRKPGTSRWIQSAPNLEEIGHYG